MGMVTKQMVRNVFHKFIAHAPDRENNIVDDASSQEETQVEPPTTSPQQQTHKKTRELSYLDYDLLKHNDNLEKFYSLHSKKVHPCFAYDERKQRVRLVSVSWNIILSPFLVFSPFFIIIFLLLKDFFISNSSAKTILLIVFFILVALTSHAIKRNMIKEETLVALEHQVVSSFEEKFPIFRKICVKAESEKRKSAVDVREWEALCAVYDNERKRLMEQYEISYANHQAHRDREFLDRLNRLERELSE